MKKTRNFVLIALVLCTSLTALSAAYQYQYGNGFESEVAPVVEVTGFINEVLAIRVVTSNSTGLNLLAHTPGQYDNIAVLEELSNVGAYTVTIKSTNKNKLKGVSNLEEIEYSIKYGGGSALSFTNGVTVLDYTDKGITERVLSIDYTVADNQAADTYKDTLTFTIAAD